MLTYYLVLLAVLVFAGAAQREENKKLLLADVDVFWGRNISHSRAASWLFLISSLVLVCVAGLRYYVGTDYGGYFLYYDRYADSLWERIVTLDEPGYSLIAAFSRSLGFTDGRGAIFLASFITLGSVLYVFYRNTNQFLLVSLLCMFIYWDAGFNAVRQCLAVSLVFCGYEALRDRKLWQYSAWVVGAWFFHHSAVCMIIPYFFIYTKISWRNFILIALGCIFIVQSYDLLFDFANTVMEKQYALEIGSYTYNEVNIMRVLSGIAPALFFAWPKLVNGAPATKEETFCINILIMKGAVCLICMYSPCFYRMAMYFSPFSILALAYLIKNSSVIYRKHLAICVCVLYMILFFYEINKSFHLNQFHFIWERSVEYSE